MDNKTKPIWYPKKQVKNSQVPAKKVAVGVYWYLDHNKKLVIDYDAMVEELGNKLQELEDNYGTGQKIVLTIQQHSNN
jgi:hypothetical protein